MQVLPSVIRRRIFIFDLMFAKELGKQAALFMSQQDKRAAKGWCVPSLWIKAPALTTKLV